MTGQLCISNDNKIDHTNSQMTIQFDHIHSQMTIQLTIYLVK